MDRYSSEYGRRGRYHSRSSHRNSRSFDCCTPPPVYHEYDYSPTYGTYLWDQRPSRDPSDCPCTCCPHSYAGARPASASHSRRGSSSSYSSYEEDFPYSTSPHIYDAEPSRYNPHSRRRPQKPTRILVENHTDGSLRRRYGSRFPLGMTNDTTTKSILSFLAPDRRRYKVVVYWNDNTKETLEEWISTTELRQHASHLEVKKKRRVHFA